LAQRLVRVICPRCKEGYRPNARTIRELGISQEEDIVLYRGRGCDSCLQTGFRGRTGIFEFLVMDDTLRGLMMQTSDSTTLRKAAMERGMKTLREDGVRKIRAGITTVEEVLRVTGE